MCLGGERGYFGNELGRSVLFCLLLVITRGGDLLSSPGHQVRSERGGGEGRGRSSLRDGLSGFVTARGHAGLQPSPHHSSLSARSQAVSEGRGVEEGRVRNQGTRVLIHQDFISCSAIGPFVHPPIHPLTCLCPASHPSSHLPSHPSIC